MKKILIVVDMQNDFIDGSLGTPEAEAIVDNVVAKIQEYPRDCVYATRDTHQDDYLMTQEGENLPVVHCIEGTHGWEINDKVKEALGSAVVMNKPTFGSLQLADMMVMEFMGHEISECEIELVG
ncbi:MAG: isochorismatase family protein, partial [Anaerotignum sp.]|nr:isochorismatase family protein [Anaerotignum sp.]